MSSKPHTVGSKISLEAAWNHMRQHGVRHLPVLEAGKLVGIISDRDLRYLVAFEGAQNLVVNDVMTPDPYVVTPDTDLGEVALYMAQHQYGSAVIKGPDGKVTGIFTFEDGLRALSELLGTQKKKAA